MNTYLLFKSIHLISVISWMAGLLYLPRIFVYHAENNDDKKISDVFKIMEKKLYFYIMTPAMALSSPPQAAMFIIKKENAHRRMFNFNSNGYRPIIGDYITHLI